MDIESVQKIYVTKDYDKFKFFTENRALQNNLLLEKKILQSNKLHLNPIIVTEDYEVVDGQHRLKIAKKNDLKIFYMFDDNFDILDLQNLNQARKNWTQEDFLDFWCKMGNPVYKVIRKLVDKYNMSVSTLLHVFSIHTSNISVAFKDGNMKLRHTESELDDILEKLTEVKNLYKFFSKKNQFSRNIDYAVLHVLLVPSYDHQRMLRAINLHPEDFLRACCFSSVINIRNCLVDDVYNKGIRNNRLQLTT